jgi:hypothetical protein
MPELPPARNAGCGLGTTAAAIASMLVGAAWFATGATAGVLIGGPLLRRAFASSASPVRPPP